jgi:predicted polyphosphate/ATP-dependent NAD kinase
MRIGLIVNPYAGLGGPLAMKGSDGDLAEQALASGGAPIAEPRAARALTGLTGIDLITVGGLLGEGAALAAGHAPRIVHAAPQRPAAADTAMAARALCAAGIDLLLFAGGDGTASDLLGHTGDVPVLGVPAGVKMHSAVFATSPVAAAAMLQDFVRGRPILPRPAAVITARPQGAPVVRGHLPAPANPRRQGAKASGSVTADADLAAACIHTAHELADCPLAIISTGATMLAVKQALAGDGTLLGVDAFAHGRLIARDANERTLWELVQAATERARTRLLLGVVGGQGFLLGRGNQQISPRLVRAIGREAISVLASADKLAALDGGHLLADSGDEQLDRQLAGPISVRTGPRRRMVMQLEAA